MASVVGIVVGWAAAACLALWLLSLVLITVVYRLLVASDPASRDPLALSVLGRIPAETVAANEATTSATVQSTSTLTGKTCPRIAVGLVIAHPDDESMFFAPTLKALTSNPQYDVSVLCLSNGNAYGLGDTRSSELLQACSFLGVSKDRVSVVDHPQIQDGFKTGGWEADVIIPILRNFVTSQALAVLISFDGHGVSGHPNHRSSCRAIRHFKDSLTAADDPVSVWELKSVHLGVKFLGPVAALFMWVQHQLRGRQHSHANPRSNSCSHSGPHSHCRARSSERLLLLPSFSTCLTSMRLHASQWVWFRWLFVLLSTYPYANQLVLYEGQDSVSPHVAASAKQKAS